VRGRGWLRLANRLGVNHTEGRPPIGRDPRLRAELDEALMEGRDANVSNDQNLWMVFGLVR
jgi:hypothetical protein